MILGLSIETFTMIHTVISLIGIASGLVAVIGMFGNKRLDGWTSLFLLSTAFTSATGFLFPFTTILPSHIVGIISLVVLAPAFLGRYKFALAGAWRWVYVACAVFALYLNAFVGVVQAFQKIPALKALAPTQSEPPFLTAQFLLLIVIIVSGAVATLRFHPLPVAQSV